MSILVAERTLMPEYYLYKVRYSEGTLPFKYSTVVEVTTNFMIEKPEDLLGYVYSEENIHFSIPLTLWNITVYEVSAPRVEWTRKKNGYEKYELN
jgi:hypothetical protein